MKNKIDELRKERNLTWDELAEELNLSRSVIWRFGKGEREIKHGDLERIATFFNVSTDYLLGLSENRNLQNEKEKQQESDPIFFSLYDEVKELTDAQKEEILDIIKKLKAFRN